MIEQAYALVQARGGVVDLSHRARFRLLGNDRVRYLNGQISNNVRDLPPGVARHACVMTAKGRMNADIFFAAAADCVRVDAAGSLREPLAARLERYIIADDVELLDVTDSESLFHVLGPAAAVAEQAATGCECVRTNRLGWEGLDVYAPASTAGELWDRLSAEIPVVDSALWEVLRVESGIPEWGAELDENTIPVEAGLDRTAIDYHKGCYIGQEVISRLKSIGHVNRTLTGFVARRGPLRAGMELFAPGDNSKAVGRITSAVHSFALACPIGLGYLKRGVKVSTLVARAPGGESEAVDVEIHSLPFIS